MPSELITKLNWVDILVIIALIRIIYIGVRQGFIVEFSKTLGVVFAIILSFHYYITFSSFIHTHSPLPASFSDLICFTALFIGVILLFKFIREGLALVIKAEPIPFLNSWGGLILGGLRAWLVTSVFIYVLLISGFSYIEQSARQSYGFNYIIHAAPQTYSFSFNNLIGKFFSGEKINQTVFDVINNNPEAPKREG